MSTFFRSVILVLTLNGCTTIGTIPADFTINYPPGAKHNISVLLVIEPSVRAAEWRYEVFGDTWAIPLGENLATNSEHMARHVFSSVDIQGSVLATPDGQYEAILRPSVVSIESSLGVSAFSDTTLSLILSWELLTPTGQTVWVETVTGNGINTMGGVLTRMSHMEEQARDALQELFLRSFAAIESSPEIKRFVDIQD